MTGNSTVRCRCNTVQSLAPEPGRSPVHCGSGAEISAGGQGVSFWVSSRHHLLYRRAFMRTRLVRAMQSAKQPLELVGEVFIHLSVHEGHGKTAGEGQQLGHTSEEIVGGIVVPVAKGAWAPSYSMH